MDAEDIYSAGHEQTLPVLSRSPPGASWPVADLIPHPDDLYTIPPPATIPTAAPLPVDTTALPPGPSEFAPDPSQPAQTNTAERNGSSSIRKPRKAAHTTAGKSTLFWVNTDPQSASGGNKEETLKRIRSHVMSEHNRKKRLESTKRYKTKPYRHPVFQKPEAFPSASRPSRSPQGSVSSSPSSSSNSRRSSHVAETEPASQQLVHSTSPAFDHYRAAPVEVWDESWDDGGFDEVVGFPATQAAPSLWSYVGSGAHDPFNTGHTQLTDRMMRHLQNCKFPGASGKRLSLKASVLWDLTQEAYPLKKPRHRPKLQAHWTALIQRDPAILHAAICMSTSNAAMQRGELPIRDPNQKRSALVVDTFHHRGETIRLVNEGLSDPAKASSDELIAAVSTLLTIEVSGRDGLPCQISGLTKTDRIGQS